MVIWWVGWVWVVRDGSYYSARMQTHFRALRLTQWVLHRNGVIHAAAGSEQTDRPRSNANIIAVEREGRSDARVYPARSESCDWRVTLLSTPPRGVVDLVLPRIQEPSDRLDSDRKSPRSLWPT